MPSAYFLFPTVFPKVLRSRQNSPIDQAIQSLVVNPVYSSSTCISLDDVILPERLFPTFHTPIITTIFS
jgi:hypothetical protein